MDNIYPVSANEVLSKSNKLNGVIWYTGLSGSGKSTSADLLSKKLNSMNIQNIWLDGDNLRSGINSDLGFSDEDRIENLRRTVEIAKLFFNLGYIVIVSTISPFKASRDFARNNFPSNKFIEVFMKCDIKVCAQRDSKSLYKKANEGKVRNFTGITSTFEEPKNSEVVLNSSTQNTEINHLKLFKAFCVFFKINVHELS